MEREKEHAIFLKSVRTSLFHYNVCKEAKIKHKYFNSSENAPQNFYNIYIARDMRGFTTLNRGDNVEEEHCESGGGELNLFECY